MKPNTFIVTVIFVLLIAGFAYAGQFGAPQPMAQENGFSLGMGYFNSVNRWEPKDNNLPTYWKVSTKEVYAQASGATKNIEGFVRIGGISLKADEEKGAEPARDFEDNGRTFFSIGGKAYAPINKNVGIGPFASFTWYGQFTDSVDGVTVQIQSGAYDLSAGVALQGNISILSLYAGPFVRMGRAEAEVSIGDLSDTVKAEPRSNFGGIGGLRVTFSKMISFEAEAQYTDEMSFGGLVAINF